MQSYFEGGNPELDALLERLLSQAKPGDKQGGRLAGKRDQLQKLPNGKMQGHGGEYVVNAEATDAFGPLLEQLNRAVPAKKGRKYEKPKKGKGLWDGGDAPGGAPGGGTSGEGETGPGPGAGVGADVGATGATGPAGPGTGVDMGAPPAGPGAATPGTSIGHSVTGGGGATGAGSVGASTDATSAGVTGAEGAPGATAEDVMTAGLAMTPSLAAGRSSGTAAWGGQDVSDALKGFIAALMPNFVSNMFGMQPSNLTAGQKSVATAIGLSPTPPGTSLGVRGLMGAANNANLGHANTMFGGSQRAGAVTPALSLADMTAMAGADIASTPGVTTADTGPSTGPGMGAGDVLPAELQALDMLQKQENSRGRASGRSPIEEGLYDLAGRGMQGQNPWALAEAAKPFAGGQSMDSLLAAARKFFAT